MADPREPNPAPDPLLGKTLAGRYLIKALIDRGGMGKVYRAEQQPLGRMVALKTLDLLDPRGEFKERFFNEASTASRLTHPNTVRIFDYGRSEDGVYFLTMEFLEGQSLHRLVKSEAPLDPHRLIHIIRQVCGALHEAHDQGIVHRDLKPGNIFLTRHGDGDEFVKVLDFGLVKNLESDVTLSQTGQALGSPLYMAPEQVEGDKVDRRSDIYALGLVMYVALCGKVPFKKGSVATIMMQQVTATIPSFREIAPDVRVHPGLEWIVRRCIEKDKTKRIASMRELSVALKLVAREIRGDFPTPIPWELAPDGTLALPPEILGAAEETAASAVRPMLRPVAQEPLEPAGPPTWTADFQDVPSSPTLNRSSASVAAMAGGALAGGGLLVLLLTAVIAVILLVGGGTVWWFTRAAPVDPPPIVRPVPVPIPPDPAPVAPRDVLVTVDSRPSGAEVFRDGALLGTTPLLVSLTADAVMDLELRLDGHEPRQARIDGSVPVVDVPLKATRKPTPTPRPQPGLIDTRAPPMPDPVPAPAPAVVPGGRPAPRPTERPIDLRDPWEDDG